MPKRKKTKIEKFDLRKAVRGLNIADPVSWAKSLSVGIRLSIIAGLVALAIFGWGYYKGKKNLPVSVDISDTHITVVDKQGQPHTIDIENGIMMFDGKRVKVKDVEGLKPYGISLKPKVAAGMTSAGSPGVGMALEVAHFYKANLDILGLNSFLGVGVSYDLELNAPIKIKNSALGLAVGRDTEVNANALLLYYTIAF